jgi:hypothetical protein
MKILLPKIRTLSLIMSAFVCVLLFAASGVMGQDGERMQETGQAYFNFGPIQQLIPDPPANISIQGFSQEAQEVPRHLRPQSESASSDAGTLTAGCTTAPNGQYPGGSYTIPSCNGSFFNILTDAWTGEYTTVNVVTGNTYKFRSSVATDYLTVANTAATTVYSTGTQETAPWEATFTGQIRIYRHLSSACNSSSTSRTISMSCSEPAADEDFGITAFTVPAYLNESGSDISFTVSVRNNGAFGDDVSVSFTANGSPIGSVFSDTIESGATEAVVFTWNNVPAGLYEIVATLPLDDNPANNTATRSVAVATSDQLAQNFEVLPFPPAGWNTASWQRSTTGVTNANLIINGTHSAFVSSTVNTPDRLFETPVLDLDGTWTTFSFWRSGLNNGLGSGNASLQVQYRELGDETWENLGAAIVFTTNDRLLEVFDISAIPNGQYSFRFRVTSTFDNTTFFSFVAIDDIVGPAVYVSPDPVFSGPSTLALGNRFNIGEYDITYTISNTGGANLSVNAGTSSDELELLGLPLSIAPGNSAPITVRFSTAGLPAGSYIGSFALTTNDPLNGSVTVNTSATILQAVVTNLILEDFNAVASGQRPNGWTGNFGVQLTGGIDNSRRLTRNLYGTGVDQNGQFTTSFVEMGDDPDMSFYYRVVNWSGYPGTPTPAASVTFTVFVSTDFGATFNPIWVYNSAQHVVSTNYAEVVVDVSAYAGQTVLFGVSASRITGDFFLDFDNFLIGTPPNSPQFAVSGTSAFGTVNLGSSNSQQFSVTNEGGGTLEVTSASISGPDADDFGVTGFTAQDLAFGENMTFNVVFAPTSGGAKEATLVIGYNDGSAQTEEISLSGTGFDATIREPFVQNFQTALPANWENRYGILAEETVFVTAVGENWLSESFMNNAINGTAARLNLYVSGANPVHRWLITPPIDLDDLGSATTLKFDLGITLWSPATTPAQLTPESSFAVVISTDNGATWSSENIVFQKSGANGDQIKPGGETFYVDLSAYSGTVKLGFYGSRTTGTTPDLRFYLTNVGMHETFSRSMDMAGWNLVSLPGNNIRVRELAAQNQVQGVAGANAFYGEASGYDEAQPNLYLYNNIAPGEGSFHASWQAPTNFSTRLASGQGFLWYFFTEQSANVAPLPFTLNAVGLEPVNEVVRTFNPLTNFTLMGNPFGNEIPSGNVSGPIQGGVQLWDGNAFVPTATVPAFSGFFVEKAAEGNVTIAAEGPMASDETGPMHILFKIVGEDANGNMVRDLGTRMVFKENATHHWDMYDMTKIPSLNASQVTLALAGEREGELVYKVVDSYPSELADQIEANMSFDVYNFSGSFEIEAELKNIPDEWQVQLFDSQTGMTIDLRTGTYVFEASSEGMASEINPFEFVQSLEETFRSASIDHRFTVIVGSTTTSTGPGSELPTVFALNQNYPNPFNPTTQVSYDLPQSVDVRLDVYNVMGQRVATLVNSTQSAGRYNVTFDARNLSSGVYLYRLQAGSNVFTKKMTLVK